MKNKILPYNTLLKALARKLRQQGILSGVLLWKQVKNKSLGVEFQHQVLIDNFIVDFYCHELMLAIEIDGNSHNFTEVQINDIHRQNILENMGVKFICFKDAGVRFKMADVIHTPKNKISELK